MVFALAPDSEYKGIDADEMKKLADAASKALVDALKEMTPIDIRGIAWPFSEVRRVARSLHF